MKYLNLFLSGYSVKLCVLRDTVKSTGLPTKHETAKTTKKYDDLKLEVFVSAFVYFDDLLNDKEQK